jgi:hypothetical protein
MAYLPGLHGAHIELNATEEELSFKHLYTIKNIVYTSVLVADSNVVCSPPKRWYPHGVTTQKNVIDIFSTSDII